MTTLELFRTPEDRFGNLPGSALPRHSHDVDGVRMHYLDVGPRDGTPMICFHGEPTWVYSYRRMIAPLMSTGHRVIAPDYAGFGRCDKPTDRGWYTYDRHVAFADANPIFPYRPAGQALCDLLSSATSQYRIDGAGHFVQEDRGSRLGSAASNLVGAAAEQSQ